MSVEGISLSVLNQRSQEFSLNQQDTYALPQQSSSTGTGDGREESSGQPTATRDSGFQVTLQPVLVRDSEVLLSLDIGYSRGVGRTDASQDLAVGETLSSQITRDFHHDLRVPLGDLVLLNVYQHADLLTSRSGTGRPSFWALGGGRSAQRIVTTYVLSLRTVRLKPVPGGLTACPCRIRARTTRSRLLPGRRSLRSRPGSARVFFGVPDRPRPLGRR